MRVFLLILITQLTYAGLKSPFSSSVDGITSPNTHYVDDTQRILRGMRPSSIEELVNEGITDIIIFKHQTRNEVDKEITELKKHGYPKESITHIPFQWRSFTSYKVACEQTIEALTILKNVYESGNRKAFFHCTVGEDRTGHLAGLWRMLSIRWSKKQAFYYEMCENGYSRGNPRKPYKVTSSIDKDLTPLFNFMADLIDTGDLSLDNLDSSLCQDMLPEVEEGLKCRNSSKL